MMMKRGERGAMRRDSGFSMIELMIAMTVTLIISGAIYGLLTAGSTAFRREPEMADRQQNIRVAMDLISRDVFSAGAALPTFSQVFSRDDVLTTSGSCVGAEGVNGCGPEGSLGATAQAARGPGDPGGDPATTTDVLEIVSADETCPMGTVCSTTLIGDPGDFLTRTRIPACVGVPGMVLLISDNLFSLHMSQAGATGDCGSSVQNGAIKLAAALPPWDPPLSPAPAPNFLYAGSVVRYMIAPSNDPLDPAPALWRSRSGLWGRDGIEKLEPDESGFPGTSSPWQLVARGIEDLQIEYMAGNGLWLNRAPIMTPDGWDSLVRQVRITLSARSSAPNLQGATTSGDPAGPVALRGQLVTVVAPRAALNELRMRETPDFQ